MKEQYILKTKRALKEIQQKDEYACFGKKTVTIEERLRNPFKQKLYLYFKLLRKYEYFCFKRDTCNNLLLSKLFSFQIKTCDCIKNRIGLKIGVEIKPFSCEASTRICHPNVIINGYVGENCIFHGNNVIGNKKSGEKTAVPNIGNNVDIGIGAMIIGNVELADNCVVGAGTVVTKSFKTPGTTIAGVPAREI